MFFELKLQERMEAALEAGKKIGCLTSKVSIVRNNKGKLVEETVIKMLSIDREQYDVISEMIENNPDTSDSDIAEAILDKRDATSDV
jgi:hypothetical protein